MGSGGGGGKFGKKQNPSIGLPTETTVGSPDVHSQEMSSLLLQPHLPPTFLPHPPQTTDYKQASVGGGGSVQSHSSVVVEWGEIPHPSPTLQDEKFWRRAIGEDLEVVEIGGVVEELKEGPTGGQRVHAGGQEVRKVPVMSSSCRRRK